MLDVLKGVIAVLCLIFVFGVVFIIICFAVIANQEDKMTQYKHIVVNNQQYVIEDLSDLWERTDFIEFTTKDGSRIHAATYELRK